MRGLDPLTLLPLNSHIQWGLTLVFCIILHHWDYLQNLVATTLKCGAQLLPHFGKVGCGACPSSLRAWRRPWWSMLLKPWARSYKRFGMQAPLLSNIAKWQYRTSYEILTSVSDSITHANNKHVHILKSKFNVQCVNQTRNPTHAPPNTNVTAGRDTQS